MVKVFYPPYEQEREVVATMRKITLILGLALAVSLALAGCQSETGGAGDPVPGGVMEPSASLNENKNEIEGTQPATEEVEWDKIPMVMVNGKLYYSTGEESTVSGRCGTMDGEITSTVDGSEIPTKDDESNFGAGFGYQYGIDNTIEVFMNEQWIVFEQREGTGSQVRYGDRMIDADGLSEETLEWLNWYNSLLEEQQLAVSAVPSDLLEDYDSVKTEDAEASTEDALGD